MEGDTTTIGYFDADAILTANFGDSSNLGTISGTIDNFEADGEVTDAEITLGSTDIINENVFTGMTSGVVGTEAEGFTGKWGGQFFGNGELPTDHPGVRRRHFRRCEFGRQVILCWRLRRV